MLEMTRAAIAALDFYAMSGIDFVVGQDSHNYFIPKINPPLNIDNQTESPKQIEAVIESSELDDLVRQATSIQHLQQLIKNCDNHPLVKTARQAVLGVGNPNSNILVVGDMPSADDELSGYVFSDLAGKLLSNMLKAINISMNEDCFVTNLLNWRPPAGAALKADEVQLYLPLLKKIISLQQPKIIISLGNLPVSILSGQTQTINNWRSNVIRYDSANIFTTYHPNILLKNPAFKKNAWADLLALKFSIAI
jgi:DNA polymerase